MNIEQNIFKHSPWVRLLPLTDSLLYHVRIFRRYLIWRGMNRRCSYCGSLISFRETTVDHVVARQRGGFDRHGNIYPACYPCNQLKGSSSLKGFARRTIGMERKFYFQTGEPIDVVRARLWVHLANVLYGKSHEKTQKQKPYYFAHTRENLIKAGLIKPKE